MLGLSPLILLIAGVVFAAWSGGLYLKGRTAGKEVQAKEDAPIISQWKERATSNEAAFNVEKQRVAERDLLIGRCNTEVERLSTVGKDAKTAVARAIADSRERARSFEERITGLSREAAAASGLSPEQQCDAARKTLGELADVLREGMPAPAVTVPAPQPAAVKPEPKPSLPKPLPPAIRVKP
jgi:hypothetical protein